MRSFLKRFINRADEHGRTIDSKIAYRYLHLLERCYQHLELEPNPTREMIPATDQADFTRDAPTRALPED